MPGSRRGPGGPTRIMRLAEKKGANFKVVADNRRARFDYEIGETFEAGSD